MHHIWENFDFDQTKTYKIKMPPSFMKLFIFTFITSIDQMILLEEHWWGTSSAITTNICLTKD